MSGDPTGPAGRAPRGSSATAMWLKDGVVRFHKYAKGAGEGWKSATHGFFDRFLPDFKARHHKLVDHIAGGNRDSAEEYFKFETLSDSIFQFVIGGITAILSKHKVSTTTCAVIGVIAGIVSRPLVHTAKLAAWHWMEEVAKEHAGAQASARATPVVEDPELSLV